MTERQKKIEQIAKLCDMIALTAGLASHGAKHLRRKNRRVDMKKGKK